MRGGILSSLALAMVLPLAGCAQQDSPADRPTDSELVLRLSNAGDAPLRCRIIFGHWVERDLGVLPPGADVEIRMMQSAGDGALYIPRADGRRLMMIENLVCARPGDWMASVGQVDLAPLRRQMPDRVSAGCAAPAGTPRVACVVTELIERS